MTDKNPTTKPVQGDLLGDARDPKTLVEALGKREKGKRPAPSKKPVPKRKRPPLTPVRHPNMDLFICNVLDAIPKDDMGSMEHPMFSLSKKPDHRIFRYEHRGNRIEIAPSAYGLATIFDKDILIYCVSQLMAKKNAGLMISRTVQLTAYDLLVATNRSTGGRAYDLLEKSFDRLSGTRIKTDISSGGLRVREGFGLIDTWRIIEKTPDNARMVGIEVDLSRWLFAAVNANQVLTLHREYFRLGKPLERRLYELARKHCGKQSRWQVSMEILHSKSGSSASLRKFRELVRAIAKTNHLPGYRIVIAKNGKSVTFYNREKRGRQAQIGDLLKGISGE